MSQRPFEFPAEKLAERFASFKGQAEAAAPAVKAEVKPTGQPSFRRGAEQAKGAEHRDPTERQVNTVQAMIRERRGHPDVEALRERLNTAWRENSLDWSFDTFKAAFDTLKAIPRTDQAPEPVEEDEAVEGKIDRRDIDPSNPHPGVYTVMLPSGDHRVFEVEVMGRNADFAPGKTVLRWLAGPERERKGLGFLVGGQARIWQKKRHLVVGPLREALDILLAWDGESDDVKVARYCARCGDLLTNPVSNDLGIGPYCRKQQGWEGFTL